MIHNHLIVFPPVAKSKPRFSGIVAHISRYSGKNSPKLYRCPQSLPLDARPVCPYARWVPDLGIGKLV